MNGAHSEVSVALAAAFNPETIAEQAIEISKLRGELFKRDHELKSERELFADYRDATQKVLLTGGDHVDLFVRIIAAFGVPRKAVV